MVEERKEPASPQDDKLIQLSAVFEQMQAQITAIKGEDLSRKSQMRLEELNEIRKEVQSKCAEIKERIDEVRAFIGRHVYSTSTF